MTTTNRAGRVLNIVGLGRSLAAASAVAYDAAGKVWFPGVKYRMDIGADVICSS